MRPKRNPASRAALTADELLKTAETLINASNNRPRKADLARAYSTAYYAMFHEIAKLCADTVIGGDKSRSHEAWRQVYRALEHGRAKDACNAVQTKALGFPSTIVQFAQVFVDAQAKRHSADYDPFNRIRKSEAKNHIARVRKATAALRKAQKPDKAAFAAMVLFRSRG